MTSLEDGNDRPDVGEELKEETRDDDRGGVHTR